MRRNPVIPWIVLGAAVACIAVPPAGATSQDTSPTTGAPGGTATAASSLPSKTAEPSSSPTSAFPPVTGAEPSDRVAAFYYPWYRTLATDGYWDHWITSRFQPPLDIPSDYYPVLGAYSVADPVVVAQHFAWLRGAGVGVIISSWWGQGTREDKAVPLLLDIGERYGIKVAFHIEPYGGRTADRLLQDIRYLYRQYGDHPAFFRSAAASRWSQEGVSKGLFFVWAIGFPDFDNPGVGPDYWREAMDSIHGLSDGGLVIANTTESNWIDGGHFDGLYNYATLNLGESGGFSWARGLPPDAWYVPSVLPGFSAKRIAYPEEDYVPRLAGATYAEQWRQALDTGVEPALVTITSFNEWHEGSQIEPAAEGADNGLGYTYENYSPLPPEGYLALTRQFADRFLATVWPETRRVRIRLTTTSDWTTLSLLSGAVWLRPSLVSASDEARDAGMEADHLLLGQPIGRAQAGGKVEMTVDFLLTGWESGGTLVFEIGRGNLGWTNVDFFNVSGPEPIMVKTFTWAGIDSGPRNALTVKFPVEVLLTG